MQTNKLPLLDLRIFEAIPGNNVLVKANSPLFTILAATESYLQTTGKTKSSLVGKGVFEAFPANLDDAADTGETALRASFKHVITCKEQHRLPVQRYDVPDEDGSFIKKYWNASNTPVLNDDGEVAYIIHTANDITDRRVHVQQQEEKIKGLEQAHNLFMQAPISIHMIKGHDLIIEMANAPTLQYWGRGTEVVGKPLLEALPELEGQGYDVFLREVLKTGQTKDFYETLVSLQRNGKEETGYFNFIYKPYYEEGNPEAVGIVTVSTEVTDKVMAKKDLEESEAKLRSIIAAAPAGIGLFVGRDLIVEMPNQTFIDIVGKGPDIEGKPLREVMPELLTENQPFLQILDDVYTSGKMFQSFGSVIKIVQNGVMTDNYYNVTCTPLFDSEGKVYAILDIAIDVTEQVLVRKRLEESEQQVRSLVESAPFPIGVYKGKEMRVELANQAIINAWGKGHNVIGKKYSEILPELNNQEVFQQLDDVFTKGIPFHAKNKHIDLLVNGKLQPYYFNYSFTPLFDASGSVYGIMNTAADVTDLNLAKQKVEESGRNLHNMILQSPVAMCILKEPTYVVEIANERMFELWGKTAEQVMNKPLFEGLPEVKEQGIAELLKNVYTTGEPFKAFERPVDLPRSGKIETTYLNFVYQALYESNGVISGIMAVAIDVTEQVLARHNIEEVVAQRTRELAEANKTLAQNNQELEQFAYITSHDLQEPLRKVSTFTGMLKSSLGEVDERSKTYLSKIEASSARMSQLIRDVLDFSQLSKKREIFEPVNLRNVVENITSDFELLIEQKGATLNYSDLPIIEANPLQMRQLFGNLLSNALKFTRKDVLPVITIVAKRLSKEEKKHYEGLLQDVAYFEITVNDNGIGFNQEHAEKIFGIFQRLHGKTEYAGTGIGLALCKKIIQNHHGEIWATSTVETGTVFTIILPEKQS